MNVYFNIKVTKGLTSLRKLQTTMPSHKTEICAPKNWSKDQYEELAKYYDKAIGSLDQRSDMYKHFFVDILKEHKCHYVLDASCGTGVDSIILLEHGFKVVSVDLSAQMLECAKAYKAQKKGNPQYDEWIIKQGSWETLPDDIATFLPPGTQFDAVVCLANSISHVLNDDGEHTLQMTCLRNLAKCVKPGGVLLIDHRNYDAMLYNMPPATKHNVYYKYQNSVDIKSKLIMKDGKPEKVALDFYVEGSRGPCEFRLFCYPHRLSSFSRLLERAFDSRAAHRVYGDFQPIGRVQVPGFYQHVMLKDT